MRAGDAASGDEQPREASRQQAAQRDVVGAGSGSDLFLRTYADHDRRYRGHAPVREGVATAAISPAKPQRHPAAGSWCDSQTMSCCAGAKE
jgi:hypothetical protein